MTSKQFNAAFRPLVDLAWRDQCAVTGVPPNNRTAKDRWYREQLVACCGIRTSKSATGQQQRSLLSFFGLLSKQASRPHIAGWSEAQNARFAELVSTAWRAASIAGHTGDSDAWLDRLLESAGVYGRQSSDQSYSFDQVMAALAIVANDQYWLTRTAEAAEIRMRWQIRRYLGDLQYLTKTPHTWDYVCGIWHQSSRFPLSIEEAPAETLRKVLAILDTHVRRLCKDYGFRPSDLPSRAHPHTSPVLIREDNHHLHVGHDLDHCPPVRVPVHA